jgi:hypothetical protein
MFERVGVCVCVCVCVCVYVNVMSMYTFVYLSLSLSLSLSLMFVAFFFSFLRVHHLARLDREATQLSKQKRSQFFMHRNMQVLVPETMF